MLGERKKERKQKSARHTKTEVTKVARLLIKFKQVAPQLLPSFQLLLRSYFSDKPDSRSMAICISLPWSQGCFYRTS
jgi:hypothetical protein